jgi:hypothetical protein
MVTGRETYQEKVAFGVSIHYLAIYTDVVALGRRSFEIETPKLARDKG